MARNGEGTVVLITRDGMGEGDRELRHVLVKNYLTLLDQSGQIPDALCFYADGVKLAVEGSPVLAEIASLGAKGAKLVVCTTCLNHYGLMDRLAVGAPGGMTGIVEAQFGANRVISI